MKNSRLTVMVLTLGCAVIASAPAVLGVNDDRLLQELAEARSGTARYHDVQDAEADGYINTGLYEPGEGLHYLKIPLIDEIFDPSQPEILLYAPGPSGRLRLVAVEYIVPLELSENAPEGFTGDFDIWREAEEGFPNWELTAWVWMHNPDGVFAFHNPRVP